jgi:carboxymethylenebutenolidase
VTGGGISIREIGMGKMETTQVDGADMDLYVATPPGKGPFPAVALMYHRGGIDDFTKDRADRLAGQGYISVAPDLFHRYPEAENPLERLDDPELEADINAAVTHVRAKPEFNGKLAIMGHCMGGRIAFLGASVNPAFSAAVIYYGGNMFKVWGKGKTPPFQLLSGIRGPVIGFFGNDDKNPSPDDVTKIDAELTRLGKAHEFHRYDGAGHAFQNFVRPEQYREAAEKDSWARTIAFLKTALA